MFGSGGTRTHAPEETGALNQRLNRSATLPSIHCATLRKTSATYLETAVFTQETMNINFPFLIYVSPAPLQPSQLSFGAVAQW